ETAPEGREDLRRLRGGRQVEAGVDGDEVDAVPSVQLEIVHRARVRAERQAAVLVPDDGGGGHFDSRPHPNKMVRPMPRDAALLTSSDAAHIFTEARRLRS